MMSWNYDDVEVGDFISTRVVNKKGDRNLDGMILQGVVTEKVDSHRFVRLESGWCAHPKDDLLEHRKAQVNA